MLLKISRYYNTSERLTGMCQKISAQLIRVSIDWISQGGTLWEIPAMQVRYRVRFLCGLICVVRWRIDVRSAWSSTKII